MRRATIAYDKDARTIYSIGSNFAGGGIGTIAYHSARGLYRRNLLQHLFCSSFQPTEISSKKISAMGLPSRALRRLAVFDTSGWIWYLQSLLFDAWTAQRLVPADMLQVWSNFGLKSLLRSKEMGMMTMVKHASSHPIYQAKLLTEEYARWGRQFRVIKAISRRSAIELEMADYVCVPSDFVYQSFLAQDFSEERLLKIPFGSDTERYYPPEQQTPHPFRVLFVGQIGLRKGVPDLLEAWRQLAWHDAELWLVGNVSAEFKSLLPRWNGLPGLKLIRYIPDPVVLYQQSDLFVFPTIEEGSALVTYEALACGLPTVTTQNSGSIIRDGIEGFIIPIRDADAVAQKMEVLRSDDRLRHEMGQRARQRSERFSWNKHSESFAQVTSELISQRRS